MGGLRSGSCRPDDPAAAEAEIAGVEDDGLAGRDGAKFLRELHMGATVRQRRHRGGMSAPRERTRA